MKLNVGSTFPDFGYDTPFSRQESLYSALEDRPAIILFLRYYGCTICQLDMHELSKSYDKILASGGKVFVVLQSDPAALKSTLNGLNPYPFDIICDPDQALYNKFEIKSAASKLGLVGMAAIKKMSGAKALKLEHGAYEGSELQLPAAFGIKPGGTVFYSHYGKNVGDTPSVDEMAELLKKA